MRSVIEWLVDHATTVSLAVGAVALFGLLAYITLPRESSPDITIPVVLVTTPYPGVSPADVEELISTPLSKKDIAAAIGTTPESLSRLILRLTDDQIIDWKGREIRILSNPWRWLD